MRYLLFILFPLFSLAQQDTSYRYWVQFTDKGSATVASANPQDLLSDRAIARRLKQGIDLMESDLAVYPSYISEVENLGARVHSRSKWLNGVVVFKEDTLIAPLLALPFVEAVNPFGSTISAINGRLADKFDSEFDTVHYGAAFHQLAMLGGDVLHQQGYQGEGLHIAVLDAGFYKVDQLAPFDPLFTNNQLLGSWDFVANEASVYEDHSHGMAVLSTMGGQLGEEIVGTAPKASYWLLRSEDVGSENLIEEYYWAAAAEYADSVGADIINSSLGYTTFDDSEQNHSYADLDGRTTPISIAATMAASKGIIVCNSAGNAGNDPWYYIGAPADADSILAVGAVGADEYPTSFSSFGPASDGRVKPNVSAQGGNAVVSNTSGVAALSNGTSFASPILAGMTACLWQAHPEKTNVEVMNAIMQSAHLFPHSEEQLGYGIPDFTVAHALLGIGEGAAPSIVVYPNPLTPYSQLYVQMGQEQALTYTLYSVDGKKLMQETVDNAGAIFKLPKTKLSAGVYVLEVIVGDYRLSEQIVVVD